KCALNGPVSTTPGTSAYQRAGTASMIKPLPTRLNPRSQPSSHAIEFGMSLFPSPSDPQLGDRDHERHDKSNPAERPGDAASDGSADGASKEDRAQTHGEMKDHK